MIKLEIHKSILDIEQGEFVALYGTSGVGKTSVLNKLSMYDDVCFPSPRGTSEVNNWAEVIRLMPQSYKVYLFDEPTNYDVPREVRVETIRMTNNLHAQGKTIIMASHDWGHIEFATRIIEMFLNKTFIEHGSGMFRRLQ